MSESLASAESGHRNHDLNDTPSSLDSSPTRPRITIPPSSSTPVFVPKTRSRHRANSDPRESQSQLQPSNGSETNPQHTIARKPLRMESPPTPTIPFSPQSQPTAIVHAFPSRLSGTTVYIVIDPVTEEAAIINPVLDLDSLTNEIRTRSADRLLKFISDEGLTIRWILETSLHRDRISACRYIQLGLRHIGDGVIPKVCIGENSFCTCGDDSADENDTASRVPSSASSVKNPEAFDKLFEDAEQFPLGNIIAQCTHLEDHEGIEYAVGQNVFSSSGLKRLGEGSADAANVIHHAEPPPEKPSATNGGPVSSRQSMTIDEVLGSAERLSLNGDGQSPAPSPSPMLAFYAEQVNTRGGRIPKKINLPMHRRQASLASLGEQTNGSGSPNGKGKEREKSTQPVPLRIPRKLSVIMC